MGTSLIDSRDFIRLQDHPHAYGDKRPYRKLVKHRSGSSPRVWGQVCKKLDINVENRIIPTRMGTRKYDLRGRPCPQDHPHAYGDKIIARKKFISVVGSSPRVWGQEAYFDKAFNAARIIPTRMGTSSRYLTLPMIRDGSSPRVWGQVFSEYELTQKMRIIPTRMGTRRHPADDG